MSLINKITSRRLDDLLNDGARLSLTGTLAGGTTDGVILSVPDNRYLMIAGFHLSSNNSSADPVLVSLGLKLGTVATQTFFQGYVGPSSPVSMIYVLGDWRFGDLGYDLVATTGVTINTLAFTVFARQCFSPTPLGYIEQIGAPTHANPVFPEDSGLARGQSEL